MRPRAAGSVAVAAAAVMLAGCGGDAATTAAEGLEAELVAELGPLYEDLTLFGVDCPADAMAQEVGHVFACTAEVERQFVRVRVELTDALGGYSWNTLDVVHDMDRTEELVATEMSTALEDEIALDCGSPRIRVLPVGTAIVCEATDSGRNGVRVLLTVNGAGQTGWEVLD